MSEIVAVRREGGEITAYKLDDGTELDKQAVVSYLMSGHSISDVMLAQSKYGEYYLRSAADGDPSNNLDNLPTF